MSLTILNPQVSGALHIYISSYAFPRLIVYLTFIKLFKERRIHKYLLEVEYFCTFCNLIVHK